MLGTAPWRMHLVVLQSGVTLRRGSTGWTAAALVAAPRTKRVGACDVWFGSQLSFCPAAASVGVDAGGW